MAEEQGPDFFGTTFSIEDEDHTLANSLRFFLNKK
jgi:DNA-directed RNA polymerase I and III subunit RPAC2